MTLDDAVTKARELGQLPDSMSKAEEICILGQLQERVAGRYCVCGQAWPCSAADAPKMPG